LTDNTFHVIQFTESFLILEVETELTVPKFPAIEIEAGSLEELLLKNQFVFVSLKSSNEVIHDYQIYHNNNPICDSQQQNSVYEQFLNSTFKAGTEKDNKKYVHSQNKDVARLDTSACGVFISMFDIINANGRIVVKFPISIPYRDILQLPGFVDFPNYLFGEVKIRFTLERNSLVWCQVSPKVSIARAMIQGIFPTDTPPLSSIVAIEEASFSFTRQFTQIGLPTKLHFVTGWDNTTSLPKSTAGEFTFATTSMRVIECHANCSGFQYNDACRADLREFFTKNPFVANCQKIIYNPFNTGATKNGFSGTTCNLALNMVTDFLLLFPRNA
jgi:hypothetical protein